jgi:CheY-like chemotaxis protein
MTRAISDTRVVLAISKRGVGASGQRQDCATVRWTSPCYLRTPVDTPVRLLVVDLDARHSTVTSDLAEEEGIDVRTAVDAKGAISQCRLEYLDLVMINAGIDGESGVSLLEAIRTLRPTVRAVLMNGAQVPIRQVVRELRNEPRHVPCFDEFQHVESPLFALPISA